MRFIPYSHQSMNADDIAAVVRVLQSDWLTQGPSVARFESALARRVKTRFVAVFNSGTAALHAAYFAADIQKGDEVITSPLTFASTAYTALWQGGKVVFADIEETTGNLDPVAVAQRITPRTKVIAPVDYGGLPCRLDALKKIARRNKLIIIEDAAHALGARYRKQSIGSLADMIIFSFHPVKSITTGEGGAIATNRKDFYDRMILFRNNGITRDPRLLRSKSPGGWYYEMQVLGLNYRMNDLSAALGLNQLRKLSRFVFLRRAAAARYEKMLSGLPQLVLPREYGAAQSAWHLYPVRLTGAYVKKRATIFEKLRAAGIGVQVHYIPVYWHPYFAARGYKKGLCPRAEAFYAGEISLPLFPGITLADQQRVVKTLRAALLA